MRLKLRHFSHPGDDDDDEGNDGNLLVCWFQTASQKLRQGFLWLTKQEGDSDPGWKTAEPNKHTEEKGER